MSEDAERLNKVKEILKEGSTSHDNHYKTIVEALAELKEIEQ